MSRLPQDVDNTSSGGGAAASSASNSGAHATLTTHQRHAAVPHDFLGPNNSLLITDRCMFIESLTRASQKYGFSLTVVPARCFQNQHWTRDYYLNSYNNTRFVLAKQFGWLNADNTTLAEKLLADTANQQRMINFLRQAHLEQRVYYRVRGTAIENMALLHMRRVYVKPQNFLVTETDVDIEGGNVIQAINKHGQPKLIIGLNGVLSTAFLSHFTEGDLTYTSSMQKALTKIARAFNINERDIIVIPQWTYHIDCILGYLGNATFLVHSFAETIRSLSQITPPRALRTLHHRLLETASHGNNDFERSIIDPMIQLFTEHGFDAIKCVGVLFHSSAPLLTRTRRYNTYSDMGIVIANFLNGVAGRSPTGRHFFLTNDCDLELYKQEFLRVVRRLPFPIEIEFCKINCNQETNQILVDQLNKMVDKREYDIFFDYYNAGIFDTTTLMLSLSHGGIRCKTNMCSGHGV